jgi:hypothetical protein
MDIAGAKALKKRLAGTRGEEASPAVVEVPEGAGTPPIYQWLGLSRVVPETPAEAENHETPNPGSSLAGSQSAHARSSLRPAKSG